MLTVKVAEGYTGLSEEDVTNFIAPGTRALIQMSGATVLVNVLRYGSIYVEVKLGDEEKSFLLDRDDSRKEGRVDGFITASISPSYYCG